LADIPVKQDQVAVHMARRRDTVCRGERLEVLDEPALVWATVQIARDFQ
jgi:hypothetical protein